MFTAEIIIRKTFKENKMKCPCFRRARTLCNVEEPPYAPSPFQAKEYCDSDKYRRCPLFELKHDRGTKGRETGENLPDRAAMAF